MSDHPFEDPIVAEIHAVRSQILSECGGDLHLLVERIQARQRELGHEVRSAPPQVPPIAGHTPGPGTAGMPIEGSASDL